MIDFEKTIKKGYKVHKNAGLKRSKTMKIRYLLEMD